jgi:hypothetical protein
MDRLVMLILAALEQLAKVAHKMDYGDYRAAHTGLQKALASANERAKNG